MSQFDGLLMSVMGVIVVDRFIMVVAIVVSIFITSIMAFMWVVSVRR